MSCYVQGVTEEVNVAQVVTGDDWKVDVCEWILLLMSRWPPAEHLNI